MRGALVTLPAALCVLALAACGGSSHRVTAHTHGTIGHRAPQPVSLMLDFTPNAVHVGIYEALAHHDDTANQIKLHVQVPGASTDAISALEAGRVDYAILDIHDLAIARQKHQNIVGFLSIVQRPLAAVIAQPGISSPRQLAGKTVGVTGDPSDNAVLDSIVAGSGGNPGQVKTINIGFNAIADLVDGRVSAATAFWSDEGVVVSHRKPGVHIFRVDDYGAPAYPELVVCATAKSLRDDPQRARELARTLAKGYQRALADPRAAADILTSQVGGLDKSLVAEELPGLDKIFAAGGRFGVLHMGILRRWARWETRFGLVKSRPDVSAMFAPGFAPTGRGAS
jgi:putative hydroxymethylpyrimidine transport system substrate-binding protein